MTVPDVYGEKLESRCCEPGPCALPGWAGDRLFSIINSVPYADLAFNPELLGDTANGDYLEQKVSQVFVILREPVYRYLMSVLESPTEAEDVTQEAFLRLFCDLRRGQPVGNVRAWLFRVAHNLAIDQIRTRHRGAGVTASDARQERVREGTQDPAPTAEQEILEGEKHQRLTWALGRLSPQERQCLELRAEGLRYREIAEVLAIRIPTVQTVLARAVKKTLEAIHE